MSYLVNKIIRSIVFRGKKYNRKFCYKRYAN